MFTSGRTARERSDGKTRLLTPPTSSHSATASTPASARRDGPPPAGTCRGWRQSRRRSRRDARAGAETRRCRRSPAARTRDRAPSGNARRDSSRDTASRSGRGRPESARRSPRSREGGPAGWPPSSCPAVPASNARRPGQHLVQDAAEARRCRCAHRPSRRRLARATCSRRFPGPSPPPLPPPPWAPLSGRPRPARSPTRARPKSRILTSLAEVTKMLSGFRSRCTIPFSCAAASPSAIADADLDRFAPGQALVQQPLPERLPLEQLHGGVEDAVLLAEIVNGEDVRVGHGGHRPGLALEARAGGVARGQALRQHFDRDVPPEARVPRPVDLAHATRAQRRRRSRTARGGNRRDSVTGRLAAAGPRSGGLSAEGPASGRPSASTRPRPARPRPSRASRRPDPFCPRATWIRAIWKAET